MFGEPKKSAVESNPPTGAIRIESHNGAIIAAWFGAERLPFELVSVDEKTADRLTRSPVHCGILRVTTTNTEKG